MKEKFSCTFFILLALLLIISCGSKTEKVKDETGKELTVFTLKGKIIYKAGEEFYPGSSGISVYLTPAEKAETEEINATDNPESSETEKKFFIKNLNKRLIEEEKDKIQETEKETSASEEKKELSDSALKKYYFAQTDSAGRFEVKLPEGIYDVFAKGLFSNAALVENFVVSTETKDTLEIILEPTGYIVGNMDKTVIDSVALKGMPLEAEIDENGNFRFLDVPLGKQHLIVNNSELVPLTVKPGKNNVGTIDLESLSALPLFIVSTNPENNGTLINSSGILVQFSQAVNWALQENPFTLKTPGKDQTFSHIFGRDNGNNEFDERYLLINLNNPVPGDYSLSFSEALTAYSGKKLSKSLELKFNLQLKIKETEPVNYSFHELAGYKTLKVKFPAKMDQKSLKFKLAPEVKQLVTSWENNLKVYTLKGFFEADKEYVVTIEDAKTKEGFKFDNLPFNLTFKTVKGFQIWSDVSQNEINCPTGQDIKLFFNTEIDRNYLEKNLKITTGDKIEAYKGKIFLNWQDKNEVKITFEKSYNTTYKLAISDLPSLDKQVKSFNLTFTTTSEWLSSDPEEANFLDGRIRLFAAVLLNPKSVVPVNFQLKDGEGKAVEVEVIINQTLNEISVYPKTLIPGQNYTLAISKIKDQADKELPSKTITFVTDRKKLLSFNVNEDANYISLQFNGTFTAEERALIQGKIKVAGHPNYPVGTSVSPLYPAPVFNWQKGQFDFDTLWISFTFDRNVNYTISFETSVKRELANKDGAAVVLIEKDISFSAVAEENLPEKIDFLKFTSQEDMLKQISVGEIIREIYIVNFFNNNENNYQNTFRFCDQNSNNNIFDYVTLQLKDQKGSLLEIMYLNGAHASVANPPSVYNPAKKEIQRFSYCSLSFLSKTPLERGKNYNLTISKKRDIPNEGITDNLPKSIEINVSRDNYFVYLNGTNGKVNIHSSNSFFKASELLETDNFTVNPQVKNEIIKKKWNFLDDKGAIQSVMTCLSYAENYFDKIKYSTIMASLKHLKLYEDSSCVKAVDTAKVKNLPVEKVEIIEPYLTLPRIQNINVSTQTQTSFTLNIEFNLEMDQTTLLKKENYSVQYINEKGEEKRVGIKEISKNDATAINLIMNAPIEQNTNYLITISNVKDKFLLYTISGADSHYLFTNQ